MKTQLKKFGPLMLALLGLALTLSLLPEHNNTQPTSQTHTDDVTVMAQK
ncbi:MAG: hypothetical protein R6X06_01790 [Gammaproteobacteria bacterium]